MGQQHTPFEQQISIQYCPSKQVFLILSCAHVIALAAIFVTGLYPWSKVFLALLVSISLLIAYKTYIREKEDKTIRELRLNQQDEWYLLEDGQESRSLHLLPAVFVHPLLVILRLRDEGGRKYAFILTRDNTQQDTLRRLRVRLRFSKTGTSV